jgi:hypothetical protein
VKFDVGSKRQPWTHHTKRSQFLAVPGETRPPGRGMREIMQNEPNLAGWDRAGGRERARFIVRNEANLTMAGWYPGPNRAKRTQFAGAVSSLAWAGCAKQTQFGGHGRIAPNKPNLLRADPKRCRLGGVQAPPGAVNCAKQTQFAGGVFEMQVPFGKGVRMNLACKSTQKTKPIARSGAPRRCLDGGVGTDLRRDAGPAGCCVRPAESKMRKTNPICRSRNAQGGPIAQNKPNLDHPGLLNKKRLVDEINKRP